VDPITAFAMAQGALKAIRSGVEFYKECQAAAADVSEITMEVSGNIGKFLDAKGVVQEAAAQAKKESEDSDDPSKVNSQALNNVMMQMQLEQAEVELREMLIYQTPGLGDIWSRFSAERQRLSDLIEEKRDRAEKEQKEARAAAMAKAARRRRKLQALLNDSSWVATILLAIVLYVGCMYLIVQDRIQQNPELGTCFIPKGSPTYDWYSTLRWVDCT
jgi:hypothetical protein